MNVNSTVPEGALVGSKMVVTVFVIALEEEVMRFVYEVGVVHQPGWKLFAGEANLEIDNNGSEIELTVFQNGNLEN